MSKMCRWEKNVILALSVESPKIVEGVEVYYTSPKIVEGVKVYYTRDRGE